MPSKILQIHRDRIPGIIFMLLVMAFNFSTGHPTRSRVIIACAAVTAAFWAPNRRPFWFLWGIAVGALLLHLAQTYGSPLR
jgi:hypothetical protein